MIGIPPPTLASKRKLTFFSLASASKMLSRESVLKSDLIGDRMKDIVPILDVTGSDSARLDNTLEFMTMAGVDLPLAVITLIPEPWQHQTTMSREKRAFYQYYATMMEPWDGPASIIFSDGDKLGAVLDRNGLRPSRYYITDDGNGNKSLILSSEVGALLSQRSRSEEYSPVWC